MYAVIIGDYFDFDSIINFSFHDTLDSARETAKEFKNSDECRDIEKSRKIVIRIIKMDVIEEV